MRVACDIESIDFEFENKSGHLIECNGVKVTCSRCDHETEAAGTSERSIRYCFARLREECPNGEDNYYYDSDED